MPNKERAESIGIEASTYRYGRYLYHTYTYRYCKLKAITKAISSNISNYFPLKYYIKTAQLKVPSILVFVELDSMNKGLCNNRTF